MKLEKLSNVELKEVNGGDDFLYDLGYLIGSAINAVGDFISNLPTDSGTRDALQDLGRSSGRNW